MSIRHKKTRKPLNLRVYIWLRGLATVLACSAIILCQSLPMSPSELPQQRIHEVVDLPERPKAFDCHVDYNVRSLPKNTSTNSTYLCQVEWAWSPMHNRLDAYYLHRGRSDWILWNKYWDDNWSRWGNVSSGAVPRRDVGLKQAAVYWWIIESSTSRNETLISSTG